MRPTREGLICRNQRDAAVFNLQFRADPRYRTASLPRKHDREPEESFCSRVDASFGLPLPDLVPGPAMTRRLHRTPVSSYRRGSLLLWCFVGLWLLNGRAASATCGDHLHGSSSSPSRTVLTMTIPETPARPGPVCSGPQCQRHQPLPAAPQNRVPEPTFLDAALLAPLDRVANETGSSGTRPDPAPVNGPRARIFRPPRSH